MLLVQTVGLHLDNDTNAFIQSKKVASPESLFMSDKNELGRAEAQNTARGISWNIGFLLGRNIIWSRRKYSLIADALVESPMNMQQMRQEDSKAEKAPEPQQIEAKDSLKKWVCGDASVIPEAIVNSNKRSPLRKEESPQNERDDTMMHIEVNPTNRKITATYTPLDRSKHDTFETKMSNSSQMEPLDGEGNGPDFYHHQQFTEQMEYEYDHLPYTSHIPNKDTTDHVFLIVFAILLVAFVHILLLGFKFTH